MAYLLQGNNGIYPGRLITVDVSDEALASQGVPTAENPCPPFDPILGSIELNGLNQSVVVRDNLVLVASSGTGGALKIIDASHPTNLTLVSTVPVGGTGLAVEGD